VGGGGIIIFSCSTSWGHVGNKSPFIFLSPCLVQLGGATLALNPVFVVTLAASRSIKVTLEFSHHLSRSLTVSQGHTMSNRA
jgi:hypothetical protein